MRTVRWKQYLAALDAASVGQDIPRSVNPARAREWLAWAGIAVLCVAQIVLFYLLLR